ncbi:ComEC/Rec2 family competence protein [Eubacterium xylanophilum]|uniref:ComEC/Rec2 family competence protein n=1 Tax=Eubacterium xylanophilum TaxID=39497 RepID=UPI00047DE635|nr:MBL fold metallo-hydrolase [Eubacterium xylanophilum]
MKRELSKRVFSLMIIFALTMPFVQWHGESFDNTVAAASLATFAYLDVGQGNAELIKVGKKNTLIDTGKKSEYDELKKQLKKLGVKKINTLIVSHPDADHMENAGDIIAKYKVKKIIMPRIKSSTLCYKKMVRAISDYNVKKITPSTGDKIKLGKGCSGKVLSVDASTTDKNEASIVMRVTYGSRTFLYMGDATARVEGDILEAGYDVSSDIYLISHHGSDTANGVLFQKKALTSKYGVAIFSVGRNSYGHPDKFVLNRANKFAKKVYRTDKKGCIIAKTNGKKISFSFKAVKHNSSSGNYTSNKNGTVSKKTSDTSSTSGSTVYITRTGKKYHFKGCRYLSSSCYKISLKDAKSQGYEPCSVCGK